MEFRRVLFRRHQIDFVYGFGVLPLRALQKPPGLPGDDFKNFWDFFRMIMAKSFWKFSPDFSGENGGLVVAYFRIVQRFPSADFIDDFFVARLRLKENRAQALNCPF